MQSLYFKIFLWFWLAMVLVSGTLIFSVVTTQTEFTANRTEQFDKILTSLVAARAADMLEDHGMGALADYLESLDSTLHWQAFLFDDEGNEILSQPTPAEANIIAQAALQTNDTRFLVSHGRKFVAKRTTGSDGTRYVFVMSEEVPSVTSLLRAPLAIQIIRALVVAFMAGLVCFWLARYITAPIRQLSAATHRLAAGNLGARVDGSATQRKDEVADLGRDFNHMAEQIESLMSSQRRLIRDISHELRSPLARLGVALGLARRNANPQSVSALNRIELEAERLNGLIGSLLRLARLESGEALMEQSPVDLDALVRHIVADADFEARGRNRFVRIIASEPCIITGNREVLGSAVENVVRNAVSYTKEGTNVEVSLFTSENGAGRQATVRVRDHGRGVPVERLADIFIPFYRVADARERSSGGTGLGLSIAERAVHLHGGNAKAENSPEGGLVIDLRFPIAITESPEVAPAVAHS
jgi:two-component system, OmpR family, sensor histidine kinase CpxA